MTPNDIDILIHYYSTRAPHPRIGAPAVKQSIAAFVEDGLLTTNVNGEHSTTLLGEAHIKQLCALAYPKPAFIGANGKEIIV